ncbi:glycosyltransferase [Streptomyces orinoci]|uniref:Glycosyltransferase n=1 Tax=Streptomyces orinoci TaxID=67339 RepID=A0ABV3K3H3_STRON|nr:glycosyltransferase [Streptomyces orinoci]
MRVFCTVTGTQGHANEVLPLATALAEAGHEVMVTAPEHLASVFEGAPVRVDPVMPGIFEVMQAIFSLGDERRKNNPDEEVVVDNRLQMILWGGGPHITSTFRTILPIAKEFRPDLVLRDGGELTGVLVAEALGIPHVSCPSGPTNVTDPAGLLPFLNERRQEVGLVPQSDPWSIYPYGRIDCVPSSHSFTQYEVPEAVAYRQPATLKDTEGLPPRLAELPGDRPLVVASVGSALPTVMNLKAMGINPPEGMLEPAHTLRAIIEGLSSLDCHAVVGTAGIAVEDVTPGDNVIVMDWLPQMLLLQAAQLFVSHGGYNSVREAVRQGVPMVALPQFGDHHHNAERLAALDLGVHCTDVTAEGVAAACHRVLTEERFTTGIREAHRRMLGLPGIEAMVSYLESVVAKHAS